MLPPPTAAVTGGRNGTGGKYNNNNNNIRGGVTVESDVDCSILCCHGRR